MGDRIKSDHDKALKIIESSFRKFVTTDPCTCWECRDYDPAICTNKDPCGDCQGCLDARDEEEEIGFEIDRAVGRR